MPPGCLPLKVFQARPFRRKPRGETQDTLEGFGNAWGPPDGLGNIAGEAWVGLPGLLPP